jgi:membrane glycosyltransferase
MARPIPERGSPPGIRVPEDRILHDWQGAYERGLLYLEALGVEPDRRAGFAFRAVEAALAKPAWESGGDAFAETLQELCRQVMEAYPAVAPDAGEAEDSFEAWRMEAALAGRSPRDLPPAVAPLRRGGLLRSAPPPTRKSMPANRFQRGLLRRAIVRAGDAAPPPCRPRSRRRTTEWSRSAARRRWLLAFLVLIPSFVASQFLLEVLPYKGRSVLELAIVVFFAALFGWISIGFWTALMGYVSLLRGRDRFAVASAADAIPGTIDPGVRTAIIMPIFEEPIGRVLAGIKVMYRSLERTGSLPSFDFFLLSDTADPSLWVEEEEGWFDACREIGGFERVFYRHRRDRVKRKSGNIADFCRRWGANYRYMVVLDADSVMAGDTIVTLVRMMEARPDAGMIQTFPVAVNRRSLFARLQQFANRLYGTLFAAGLHYWLLGDGQYWGHNAILRVAPFMEHCSLPDLPGTPPLGGEILSHDFVEAALMGRAGWTVWLAHDLPGSYEETSSSLLEEMVRDRRWCQGNLQHLALVFTRGLSGAHRALFLHGAMAYISAFLWFGFLTLSTAEAVMDAVFGPRYFPPGPSLFPAWPIWRPDLALSLAAVTAAILFLPKILAVALAVRRGETERFGGFPRLAASVLLEILLSALFAPIRMMFHGRFVVSTFLGRTVAWRSQIREDAATSWNEAFRRHGIDTAVAAIWGLGMFRLAPGYFWWLTPIVGALILSVPLSVFASRVRLGEWALARMLFLTPEESVSNRELEDLRREMDIVKEARTRRRSGAADGFLRAVIDPYVNALHSQLQRRPRPARAPARPGGAPPERPLPEDPERVSAAERAGLLRDPQRVAEMHRAAWRRRGGGWQPFLSPV